MATFPIAPPPFRRVASSTHPATGHGASHGGGGGRGSSGRGGDRELPTPSLLPPLPPKSALSQGVAQGEEFRAWEGGARSLVLGGVCWGGGYVGGGGMGRRGARRTPPNTPPRDSHVGSGGRVGDSKRRGLGVGGGHGEGNICGELWWGVWGGGRYGRGSGGGDRGVGKGGAQRGTLRVGHGIHTQNTAQQLAVAAERFVLSCLFEEHNEIKITESWCARQVLFEKSVWV